MRSVEGEAEEKGQSDCIVVGGFKNAASLLRFRRRKLGECRAFPVGVETNAPRSGICESDRKRIPDG